MSNKSNIGVGTNVNCDLNILGERPNTNIRTDKQWKYQKKINNLITEHWYKTSNKREHMLHEHIGKCQNEIPTSKLHEDSIRITKSEIQYRDIIYMPYWHGSSTSGNETEHYTLM
eukprot:16439974-Heterocapsa_arctica.AAC.1